MEDRSLSACSNSVTLMQMTNSYGGSSNVLLNQMQIRSSKDNKAKPEMSEKILAEEKGRKMDILQKFTDF